MSMIRCCTSRNTTIMAVASRGDMSDLHHMRELCACHSDRLCVCVCVRCVCVRERGRKRERERERVCVCVGVWVCVCSQICIMQELCNTHAFER